MRTANSMQFTEGDLRSAQLQSLSEGRSRVVVVLADDEDIYAIALAAQEWGLTAVGWAWLSLHVAAPSVPENDVTRAIHGFVFLDPYQSEHPGFYAQVRDATTSQFPDASVDRSAPPDRVASRLYDAIMLYSTAIIGNVTDTGGRKMATSMTNVSFEGMTGKIELTAQGDLKESFCAKNYKYGNGSMLETVLLGVFDGTNGIYSPVPGQTVVWSGNTAILPVDIIASPAAFNTMWLLLIAGIAAPLLVAGLVMFVKKKYAELEHLLSMLLSEMVQLVGILCLDLANVATDVATASFALSSDGDGASGTYKVAYGVAACVAVLCTLVAFGFRIRNGYLLHKHLTTVDSERGSRRSFASVVPVDDMDDVATGESTEQLLSRIEWENGQTQRSLIECGIVLMTMMLEGKLSSGSFTTRALALYDTFITI